MEELYQNENNPYLASDQNAKLEMNEVLKEAQDSIKIMKESDLDYIEQYLFGRLIDVFCDGYNDTDYHREMIVRFAELIGAVGAHVALPTLEKWVPKLVAYWKNRIEPSLQAYIKERNAHEHLDLSI
ncbi:MAG: hypothetical protein HRT90_06260 [Candidatus Margulisbacteria bacterium]|nr:hypothetical protein [Candidatus Margulisiibacteriota bacterium]